MKKIVFLFALVFAFSFASIAQSSFSPTTSNPTSAITNNSSDTLTYTTSHSYQSISIQPVITKTSGTAAGTAILSQSVDGVNYVNTDTLTLSDVTTNTAVWNKTTACRHFRIIIGGATTVAATATAKISASD